MVQAVMQGLSMRWAGMRAALPDLLGEQCGFGLTGSCRQVHCGGWACTRQASILAGFQAYREHCPRPHIACHMSDKATQHWCWQRLLQGSSTCRPGANGICS